MAHGMKLGVDSGFSRLSDRVGGGKPLIAKLYRQSSGLSTFTAPVSGLFTIQAIGGGGGGAYYSNQYSNNLAAGGAGGGYFRKTIELEKGGTVDVQVGIGGNGRNVTNGFGSTGTASVVTVNATGEVMTAGGGEGGEQYGSGAPTALGGSATGGDVNRSGATSGALAEGSGTVANADPASYGGGAPGSAFETDFSSTIFPLIGHGGGPGGIGIKGGGGGGGGGGGDKGAVMRSGRGGHGEVLITWYQKAE